MNSIITKLRFILVVVSFISVITVTTGDTSSLNEITKNNFCKNQFVKYNNNIQIPVKVCSSDSQHALVFPVFLMETQEGELKYNYYFKTMERQLKIRIHSETVIEQLKLMKEYRRMKFEYLKVDSVRFSIRTIPKVFQLPINRKCFVVFPNYWSTKITKDQSISLKLLETTNNSKCFQRVSMRSVSDAVQVEYKVKNGKQLYKLTGVLMVVNHMMEPTTTTTTTTTTTPVPTTTLPSRITIQRRVDGRVSFARQWSEYESGFGDPMSNFWLGLLKMHQLTKEGKYKIRFEMKTYRNDTLWYATYDTFKVGPATDYYRLTVGKFNRGESNFDGEKDGHGMSYHTNMQFSTMDQDHDTRSDSCSTRFGSNGGWWFRHCSYVTGNGLWIDRREDGNDKFIHWYSLEGRYSLKYFHMMLIPK